ERGLQRVRDREQPHIALLCFLDLYRGLRRVGDAHERLAAVHHRDNHVVPRGGLHQHVDAALLLQHLRDRRGGGVVEAAGRQRGEADRLRERATRKKHGGRQGGELVFHLSSSKGGRV